MKIHIQSNVFGDGEFIPSKYTCDGEDVSPPLSWNSIPPMTKSFVLIADDPDAPVGTWVHWVVYDIPAEARFLPESFPPDPEFPDGTRQGINDFRHIGYGGPCPPGGTHRYFFKLYALDTKLNLKSGCTKKQVLQAMEGHVLAEGSLMGKYKRMK